MLEGYALCPSAEKLSCQQKGLPEASAAHTETASDD
jgi:hypothetical protein